MEIDTFSMEAEHLPDYPFAHDPTAPFIPQLGNWIADIFYEQLPEAGFEVREEQIYMAFQLEAAYAGKQTIFAEAGVGTGKTLVYLLYAVCYARYTGRPAVIACSDESLIEQLVKPEGDLAKLARHLQLNVDARLGKKPDQYLCIKKLSDPFLQKEESGMYDAIQRGLPSFVYSYEALQAFTPYGDRKEYAELSDEQWRPIAWDSFQDCFACSQRQRCGQTLSRDYYRKATDLIICSHDFYMEHLWTYEARQREGQLPLLPAHSSVVFDEGHLVENAAQKALTYKLKHPVFVEIAERLLNGEIRETLAYAIADAIDCSEALFQLVERHSRPVKGSDRRDIELHAELLAAIRLFKDQLDTIEEEIALESELFTLNRYQLRVVEEHLDMLQHAIDLLLRPEGVICWALEEAGGLTLVIMPRLVKEVLKERLFSRHMPIIFSSATLSVDGSFAFQADSLGIERYLSFSVASPFDYAQQMAVIAPVISPAFADKGEAVLRLVRHTGGRAMILFPDKADMLRFKAEQAQALESAGIRLLVEGEQEISSLIAGFQREERSVLCSISLWEGLDIPGPSLSNVIVWSLPFPPNDPVFAAKRRLAGDPFAEVDFPYMLLRLRQGMGRLIRTRTDSGLVAILDERFHRDPAIKAKVMQLIPQGVDVRTTLP